MAFFPFDTLVSEMVKLFTVEVIRPKGPDTRYIALSPTMASCILLARGMQVEYQLDARGDEAGVDNRTDMNGGR